VVAKSGDVNLVAGDRHSAIRAKETVMLVRKYGQILLIRFSGLRDRLAASLHGVSLKRFGNPPVSESGSAAASIPTTPGTSSIRGPRGDSQFCTAIPKRLPQERALLHSKKLGYLPQILGLIM
jgi:hypothetical protein